MTTQQVIRRGILQSFDSGSYTATVLIIEATNYELSGVPIATSVDGTSAISGANCAVLFFDESNYTDGVIIAVYNASPTPPPGRITFLTSPVQEINAVTVPANTISTFTMSSPPSGALGIIYAAFFTCTLAGTSIYIAPHGGTIGSYAQIGNLPAANATSRGTGIVPIDASGKIDIQANIGNCVVTLYCFGYIF